MGYSLCDHKELDMAEQHSVFKRFPGGTNGKEFTCQCRRCKRCGFDPWVRKIPWRRACQPTAVFFLENPMDRGALQDTVYRVTKSWTRLKQLSTYVPPLVLICDLMKGSQIPADDKRKKKKKNSKPGSQMGHKMCYYYHKRHPEKSSK